MPLPPIASNKDFECVSGSHSVDGRITPINMKWNYIEALKGEERLKECPNKKTKKTGLYLRYAHMSII